MMYEQNFTEHPARPGPKTTISGRESLQSHLRHYKKAFKNP